MRSEETIRYSKDQKFPHMNTENAWSTLSWEREMEILMHEQHYKLRPQPMLHPVFCFFQLQNITEK